MWQHSKVVMATDQKRDRHWANIGWSGLCIWIWEWLSRVEPWGFRDKMCQVEAGLLSKARPWLGSAFTRWFLQQRCEPLARIRHHSCAGLVFVQTLYREKRPTGWLGEPGWVGHGKESLPKDSWDVSPAVLLYRSRKELWPMLWG